MPDAIQDIGEQLKSNSLTLILLTALGGFVATYISSNDARAQKREEDFSKLMAEKDQFVKDQLMTLVKENHRVSETVRSTLDKSQEIEIAFLRQFEEAVKYNNDVFKQIELLL